jgi:hypothetical protein
MLLDATVIIAVDAFIRRGAITAVTPDPAPRPHRSWLSPRPWALAAVPALTCALAFGWVTDYRYYVPSRVSAGHWTAVEHHWLAACARSTTGDISLPTWDAPSVTVPCSRIHR